MSLNAARYGSSGGILRAEHQVRANEYCDLDGQNCSNGPSGGGAPVGSVAYMIGNGVPAGYLAANGQAVSRTTYADLFAHVGTLYGAGDGVNTFNLPDLRGEFIRGVDDGRGVDSGRALGSFQNYLMQSHSHSGATAAGGAHSHSMTGSINNGIFSSNDSDFESVYAYQARYGYRGGISTLSAGNHSHSLSINPTGGNKTRPRNVALRPVIKY